MEQTPVSPPEILVKLNKQYWQHHDAIQEQQVRFQANPQAEQISVAFTKYILPAAKKAAAKGLPSISLNNNQLNLDFIKLHLSVLEHECTSHGLKLEAKFNPNWESELKSITVSGWAQKISVAESAIATPQKSGPTLTERVTLLEQQIKQLISSKP